MRNTKFVIGLAFFLFSSIGRSDYFVFKSQTNELQKSLLEWVQMPGERPLPEKPYNRKNDFGSWVAQKKMDPCLNTRGVVLKKFSQVDVEMKAGSCTVVAGQWDDPYSGIVFTNAKDIQIDHVVPLKNAYMSGAWGWSKKMKCLYANFLGNSHHLLPVSGHENQSKGDRAPDRYLPPNKSYLCEYLKNWLMIKFTWNLNMTSAEAQKVSEEVSLNHCENSDFVMTQIEVDADLQFKEENKDLCN